jgi:hypothetical protein
MYLLAGNRPGWSLDGLRREDRNGYSFFYRGDKCVRVIASWLLAPKTVKLPHGPHAGESERVRETIV